MERSRLPDHAREALARKRLGDLGAYSCSRFEGRARTRLNAAEEIATYIGNWHPAHQDTIELLQDEFYDTPLPYDLSAYVIVPVAASQEADCLKKTLSQYAKQDADPSTWALLLFLNYTETAINGDMDRDAVRRTSYIVQEFAEANPKLAVRVAKGAYSKTAPPIGTIRSDAWDCALYDVDRNGVAHDNLIGISHDADGEWLSPDYISAMQAAARQHPDADVLTCLLSWHNDGDYRSDANKILRYWEYLGNVKRHKLGKLITSDANTALRLGSYAAINGFKRSGRLAEMIDICERLRIAREHPYGSTEGVHFIDTIKLKTNSRRLYRAIALGYTPDEAWSYLPFLTGDDPVRELDTVELANQPVEERVVQDILRRMETRNFNGVTDHKRLQKVGRGILNLPTATQETNLM